MSNDEEAKKRRLEAWASQPYQPNGNVAAEHRIANALDYIAAQLGQINAKLDRIVPPKIDGGKF